MDNTMNTEPVRLPKTRTLVSFDWAMKRILRDKANFDVLEGFLSALLEEDIRVMALLESEANQENAGDKFNRVDLLVRDGQEAIFIATVHSCYTSYDLRQLPLYTARLITENMEAPHRYDSIKKVISVSLLHFPLNETEATNDYLYHGVSEFHGLHGGKGAAHKRNIFPEYYLIELERFPDEVKNALDEWIYFFKHSEIPDEFRAKHIQVARQKLDLMQMSVEERRAYDRFWMARASYQDEIQSAQKKGRDEGREEGQVAERYEIARQMLQHGESIDKIKLYTGLSEAEIRQQQG